MGVVLNHLQEKKKLGSPLNSHNFFQNTTTTLTKTKLWE